LRPSESVAARELASIRAQGLLRRLRAARADGAHAIVGRRRLLNLSSNDYLGLSSGIPRWAQAASSSRLLSGNDPGYGPLERSLAAHRSCRAALVFPTGYMANIGAVCSLAGRGDTILSDELNHASVIDACRLSGAKTVVYAHNDVGALERGLARARGTALVVTEGVFSMDGDVADVRAIAGAARRHGAIGVLDDAHGDFVLGPRGGGTGSAERARMDVHTGSLSKALGSLGGYVAAGRRAVDLCANRARTMIYTSALPPAVVGHARARLAEPKAARRRRLARNVGMLHECLDSMGLGRDGARTHIAPVIVGDERRAVRLGERLAERGVLAHAVRYPTVARGAARVRLSVTAWPGEGELGRGLDEVRRACRSLRVS